MLTTVKEILFLQKKREIFLVQIKMNAKTRLSIVSMTLHLGLLAETKINTILSSEAI